MDYSQILAKEFNIKEQYATNIISLLDEGNTIPFIARYRKEMHGSMDDQLIREFSEKLEYLRNLDKRREEIRNLINEQEKLTDEISVSLDKAVTLSELEDIYRPFKPKRKTRASIAKEKGLVLAEAMTEYHMPIYKELKKRIAEEKLGEVNLITLNFGSYKDYDMKNRFFNRNLAGGSMLDIGVYAISLARMFMKSKPNKVSSMVKYCETGVDEQASILLMNEEQQMATIMLSLHSKQPKRAMISCANGYIEVMEYPRGMKAVITYTDGEVEEIECGDTKNALWYEVEDMEETLSKGNDLMNREMTKDVMDIMTDIRKSWGMTYPEEE